MKKNSFDKKLPLNKETIADLDGIEMKAAVGGVPPSIKECPISGNTATCTPCPCLTDEPVC